MLIWPVYEGEDYLWGCFICISYIIIIASYCIMRSLLPAMKIACDVYDIPTHTWKKLFFANIPFFSFSGLTRLFCLLTNSCPQWNLLIISAIKTNCEVA